MASPRRPAAVGQAANRNAWVRACVLQMPRPQKRHTPSAVALHTQQRMEQGYKVRAFSPRDQTWRSCSGRQEGFEQVAGVDQIHADLSGGLVELLVAAE